MTWTDFYLICFAVGFAFSLLSFLGGGLHWHLHFPGFHGAGAHLPAMPAGAGGHAPVGAKAATRGSQVSPFNLVSLAAFLAWFGGAGFLLTRFSGVAFVAGLGLATISGLTGALIIFLFLSRVLNSEQENLDPADFEMTGVLGRISVSIRAAGTGELIYSQAGTRRTCGARSEDNKPIAKGSEVVVTRYEKGIAFVRLWTEMCGEESLPDAAAAQDLPQKGSGQ
jgi:membrane protein implicated in regulation of membrane protease activity